MTKPKLVEFTTKLESEIGELLDYDKDLTLATDKKFYIYADKVADALYYKMKYKFEIGQMIE